MPSFPVSLDASSKIGTVSLTAAEDTLDLENPIGEKVQVWCQADIDWYLDTVSAAPNASRLLISAKQVFPLMLDQRAVSRFYIKGGAASGTLVIWQPE